MNPEIVDTLKEDCGIVNNQIRGFIIELIKFFKNNKTCEDWKMVDTELTVMDKEVTNLVERLTNCKDQLQRGEVLESAEVSRLLENLNIVDPFYLLTRSQTVDFNSTLNSSQESSMSSNHRSVTRDNLNFLEESSKVMENLEKTYSKLMQNSRNERRS
jgi:hypothetical protein